MHYGRTAAEQAMIIKQFGRSATVEGLGSGVFGWLFADVDMQGALPGRSVDPAEGVGWHGANRVHGGADAYLITVVEETDPGLPMINIPVAEADLYRIQRRWPVAASPPAR
jgi:hypothetical protein